MLDHAHATGPDPRTGTGAVLPRSPASPPIRRTGSWPRFSGWTQRQSILLAAAATLAVHLLSLTRRLGSDEGGFAMVARHWHQAGGYLYGPQWVDRPPGLIALFAAADHLGPYGVRLGATLIAVGLVAALAWTAGAVGGRPAAKWAAWVGFAFASSVLLEAQRLNGELAATTFVTVSVGAMLRAVRVSRSQTRTSLLATLAGASAMAAVLMKQNFVDAFVFAAVLVGVGLATRTNRFAFRPSRVLCAVTAFVAGALVPAAATVAWATQHGGVGQLAYAVVGFRADASAVLANWSFTAPLHRLGMLTLVAWLSGLLFLLAHLAYSHRRRLLRPEPLPWAVAATAVVELFGVFAGENFWSHYLIALIPMVALAAGLSVNRRTPGARWTRRLVVLAAAVTAVTSPVAAITAAHGSSQAYTTGRWVGNAAAPGDTLVVPFTHANVINASGLTPGYPYAWSLPVRTLDPQLTLLTDELNGSPSSSPNGTPDGTSAPTWVIRWDQAHPWGLDPHNRVDAALRAHYRPVADVCGHTVWVHDGIHRHLSAIPPTSACGAGDQ